MKILKQFFTLAAAILLFTACNKNDDLAPETNSTFPADGIIRVATSVTNPQTRAGMTTENIPSFQMRIVNKSNAAYSYNASMGKEEGEWKSYKADFSTTPPTVAPLTMLWRNKIEKVKVTAVSGPFYIFDDEWDEGLRIDVPFTQDEEDLIERSDLLFMKEKEIDPSKDLVGEKIPIVFNHRFSKLNLTVKMGTEFNKLENGTTNNLITDITVGGTYRSVFWKVIEDNLSGLTLMEDILPWHNILAYSQGEGDTTQAEAKYECILIPQTVAANTFGVSFTIGDRDFLWVSPTEVVLHADTQYNLTLNVGKDVVTVAGFSATPWTEVTPENIGTE